MLHAVSNKLDSNVLMSAEFNIRHLMLMKIKCLLVARDVHETSNCSEIKLNIKK
jgi:hypothetical protein